MVGATDTAIAASENCLEHLEALLNGHWGSINMRAQRLIARAEIGFVPDHLLASPEEIANHPIYRDFLRPRGLGPTAATHIMGADDDSAIFSVDRLHSQGPFDEKTIALLDGLRPHIARSALLSRKFQRLAVNNSLLSLQSVGIPAAALDARGRIRLMNEPFSRLEQQISAGAFDMIHIADKAADALFRSAMAELASRYGPPMSIGVKGTEGGAPFVLHLMPIRGQGHDIFGGVAFILAVVPLNQPSLPFRVLVQQLYDFTPTEARVAESLLAGCSVAQIAATNGTALETVRTQTKSILAKTGTSRQTEFIARFSSFLSG